MNVFFDVLVGRGDPRGSGPCSGVFSTSAAGPKRASTSPWTTTPPLQGPAAGELSPIEVVGAVLERIEDLNQEIDAYVKMLCDEVREVAVSAERALYSWGELGPPRDVPHGVMDLSDNEAGVGSTYGSDPGRLRVGRDAIGRVQVRRGDDVRGLRRL